MLVDLAGEEELSDGETKLVPVDGEPPFRSILLLRVEGQWRAYWNTCQHISIPLDGGVGRLPLVKGKLICTTHGASFRPLDGYCVKGPCKDESLIPIALEFKAGRVFAKL
jgi:nitrite reductase/ring-hydroxylating ferredoxin subunit